MDRHISGKYVFVERQYQILGNNEQTNIGSSHCTITKIIAVLDQDGGSARCRIQNGGREEQMT